MANKVMEDYTGITIQEIFEMRKNGQFADAWNAAQQAYMNHQGHYTTLCYFWTGVDICRVKTEAGDLDVADRILAEIREVQKQLIDRDGAAIQAIGRLASNLDDAHVKAERDFPKERVFTVSSKLQAAIDALELIEKSGYIPFASPSPSSTEAEIKHAILRAHSELEHALKIHNQCYTLKGF